MNRFIEQVQHNCHISDAQYAGNYTLCIYLLKMREYYRWEKQLPFSQKLDNSDIGQWLTEREALWDKIDEQPVTDLHIDGEKFRPYESDRINQQIREKQLVYSGGYGLYGKPIFFIGELIHTEQQDDYTFYITGKELVRDLAAPPGMTQQKTIYIRRESLRRFIWEKYEESGWHQQENPLSRALACYDFRNQPEDSLEKMTDNEVNTVLQHEIGEIQAGKILGGQWQEMLTNLPHSQAEIMARSVRDNIADMLSTLPALLEKNEKAQIHFYFANISSMRKMIFPGLTAAYKNWLDSESPLELNHLISQAADHWIDIAEKMLAIYRQHGDKTQNEIETLINSNYL